MTNTNETIADIIAEMRGPKFYPWGQGGFSVEMDLTPLADRIEVAQKREIGNTRRMREALKYIKLWSKNCISEEGADNVDDMIAVVDAALAEPPRNCDVGTVEEQYERYWAFCAKYKEDCTGCPCDAPARPFTYCFSKWAQMPYEEGGEGCPEAINR